MTKPVALPWSWRAGFSIVVPSDGVAEAEPLLDAIQEALRHEKASSITRVEDGVAFHVDMFRFVPSWNILTPFDGGAVWVHARRDSVDVEYEVSLRRLFWITTIMVPLFFGTFLVAVSHFPTVAALPIVGAGWLWIYGGNALIGLLRFRSFLRRALRDMLDPKSPPRVGNPRAVDPPSVRRLTSNALPVPPRSPSRSGEP
jgi:hypothetical protein